MKVTQTILCIHAVSKCMCQSSLWLQDPVNRTIIYFAGELESGVGVLDVGTEELETELSGVYDGSHWLSADNKPSSSLRCDSLVAKRRRANHDRLESLAAINSRRCDRVVVYGIDVRSAATCLAGSAPSWSCAGFVHCLEAQLGNLLRQKSACLFWRQTDALRQAVRTPEDHIKQLQDVLDRYALLCLVLIELVLFASINVIT